MTVMNRVPRTELFKKQLFVLQCVLVAQFSSVQFSCSVMSDSLWPHELQHARPPCPSPTPRVHSDSHPSSQWCHPANSSSVIPFSSCPQSQPVSGSFTMSQLSEWGGQSTGVSASVTVLPMNTQDWYPSEWTDWISLQSKGFSRVFSNTIVQKHQFFGSSAFFTVQLSQSYMTTGKNIALTRRTFAGKVISLLFNMLCRLVITFLPRSKHLSISWLQSPCNFLIPMTFSFLTYKMEKIGPMLQQTCAIKWRSTMPAGSFPISPQ